MAKFQVGDAVMLWDRLNPKRFGTVQRVGASCLYCIDQFGQNFHSHTEFFRLNKHKEEPSLDIKDENKTAKNTWNSALESAIQTLNIEANREMINDPWGHGNKGVILRMAEKIKALKYE